jgi:hypothetical protein
MTEAGFAELEGLGPAQRDEQGRRRLNAMGKLMVVRCG